MMPETIATNPAKPFISSDISCDPIHAIVAEQIDTSIEIVPFCTSVWLSIDYCFAGNAFIDCNHLAMAANWFGVTSFGVTIDLYSN